MSAPRFTVTFFKNAAATTQRREEVTLTQLRDMALTTTAKRKAALPWMKLAIFGTKRSEKNSLRHDANVEQITGIETDYDGKYDGNRISFEAAVEIIKQHRLTALLYTSPSHTAAKPRWRILLPTSRPLTPKDRVKLVARVNGLFGGVLEPESFTLSQAYFIGRAEENPNPAHQATVVECDCIDLRPDLDAGAMGKRTAKDEEAVGGGDKEPAGDGGAGAGKAGAEADIDWAKVEEHAGWLRSVEDLPSGFSRKGRMIVACDDDLAKLNADLLAAGLAPQTPYPSWSEVGFALVAIFKQDTRFSREQIAAALLCKLPCTQHFTGMKKKLQRRAIERAIERTHDPKKIAGVIARFNKRYKVISAGGKAVVFERKHDPQLGRDYYETVSFDDLRKMYLNRRMVAGFAENGKAIVKTFANIWLEHPERRQFLGGIIFDPSRKHERKGVLNLWQGFAVKPVERPGGWALLQDHMLNIVCCGNREHYDYLMNWMARLVQHPGEPGEVAVVLRGEEGSGKGMLGRALVGLFGKGQHGLHISNSQHLVGRFNEHLEAVVMLFADEAFYAGDKQHVAILKKLITEDTLEVEAKYKNLRITLNFIHLLMASNSDWVIPASLEARRFFVLVVSNARLRDFDYFDAIVAQLEAGGYEAMLHDLLHHDLSGFNVRDVPQTEGLSQQRQQSLATHYAWWMDVLHRGFVFQSKLGLDDYFHKWFEIVTTDLLFASYSDFAKQRYERRPLSRPDFGKFMVEMGGTDFRPGKAAIGEGLVDMPTGEGHYRREAQPIVVKRPHGYNHGNLDVARLAFVMKTKLAVAWPADGEQPKPFAPKEQAKAEPTQQRSAKANDAKADQANDEARRKRAYMRPDPEHWTKNQTPEEVAAFEKWEEEAIAEAGGWEAYIAQQEEG